jgi:hypothetical protein
MSGRSMLMQKTILPYVAGHPNISKTPLHFFTRNIGYMVRTTSIAANLQVEIFYNKN